MVQVWLPCFPLSLVVINSKWSVTMASKRASKAMPYWLAFRLPEQLTHPLGNDDAAKADHSHKEQEQRRVYQDDQISEVHDFPPFRLRFTFKAKTILALKAYRQRSRSTFPPGTVPLCYGSGLSPVSRRTCRPSTDSEPLCRSRWIRLSKIRK